MTRRPIHVMVLGMVIMLVAGLWVWRGVRPVLDVEPVTVPGVITMDLDAGDWVVFEEVGTTTQVGAITTSKTRGTRISDVVVTSLDRDERIDVRSMGNVSQTVNTGGLIYAGVAQFETDSSGRYTIALMSTEPTSAYVGPGLFGVFLESLPAVLFGLVGLVTLIVGLALWARRASRGPSAPLDVESTPEPSAPPPPPAPQVAIVPSSSQRSCHR